MCNSIPSRKAMKQDWRSGPRPLSPKDKEKHHAPGESERELMVVVSGHCPQCTEAVEIAHRVALEFPTLAVQIIHLDRPGAIKPDSVFAVPTYLFDGRIISLGNPSMAEIRRRLLSVLPSSPAISLQRTPTSKRGR